jgi:hypothetical protein
LTPGGSSNAPIYIKNSTKNIENGTYITIKGKILGNAAVPLSASYTLAFALQLGKSKEKPQLR